MTKPSTQQQPIQKKQDNSSPKLYEKKNKHFQTMKDTKIKQKKKNLTLKHSKETLSIQKSKHSGNITNLKEPMKRFPTCY